MKTLFVIALSGLALGCKSEEPRPTAAAPGAPPPAVSRETAAPSLDTELTALARKWSDALARRDVEPLRTIYGTRVRLYGADMDRGSAIKAKAAALGGDYTQSIGPVEVDAPDHDHPRVRFDKTWKVGGKEASVRASLGFAREGGRWVIVEESDARTDGLLAKQDQENSCLWLVHRAVQSTDEGKAYRKSPYSTLYVCGPPGCDTFQIAGVRLKGESMDRLATFDVDQRAGTVSHAGFLLSADPKVVVQMKEACAKEEEEEARDR